jgi:hypothetical protein
MNNEAAANRIIKPITVPFSVPSEANFFRSRSTIHLRGPNRHIVPKVNPHPIHNNKKTIAFFITKKIINGITTKEPFLVCKSEKNFVAQVIENRKAHLSC